MSTIKAGDTIKLVRYDFEDMDYLDRIGALELLEDVSLDKAENDPLKVYNGTVLSVNADGSDATVSLVNYDEGNAYEDGRGKVRTVDSEYLFVI